jgi:fimbrial chaperone protein
VSCRAGHTFVPYPKLLFFLSVFLSPVVGFTQGVVLSKPLIVLDDRRPADVFFVSSNVESPVTMTVADAHFTQNQTGRVLEIKPQASTHSRADLFRVGPRRFGVDPGIAQSVRVVARPPGNLAPGEYRVHLSVSPLDSGALKPSEATPSEGGMSISIPIRVAWAVRVLYRHKVTPQGGALGAISRSEDPEHTLLSVYLERLGDTSLLGTLTPFAKSTSGDELRAWDSVPAGVFVDIPGRNFQIKIPKSEVPPGSRLCLRLKHNDPGAPKLADVEACLD